MATDLTSAQKAAMLVMSLDEARAAELLKHMSDQSVAKLRTAAESLDVAKIGGKEKREALRDFFVKRRTGSYFLGKPDERFRRVLQQAKG